MVGDRSAASVYGYSQVLLRYLVLLVYITL